MLLSNRSNLRDPTIMRHLCSLSRTARIGVGALLVAIAAPACAGPLGAQVSAQSTARPTTRPTTQPAASPAQAAARAGTPRGAARAPAPAAAQDTAGTTNSGDGVYTVERPTVLRTAPDAAVVGELRGGATVQVIAHDREWVRVRTEAWIPAAGLVPADTAFRARLSAADLRADPDGTRGKVVQWTVQFLALQTADPLRQGMADGEPYLLARGPGSENALLYLVVPPSLLGTARALDPLVNIAVTARVRDGRSEPVGVPILDLQAFRRLP
jgi:hypothetical protein